MNSKKSGLKDQPQSSVRFFLHILGVSRYFFLGTLCTYLLGYLSRGLGIAIAIPLTKGLIQKDYSFIFSNSIVAYFARLFPFMKTMSDLQTFFFFSGLVLFFTMISFALNYIASLYIWSKKKEYSLRSTTFVLQKFMSVDMAFFANNKSSFLRAKIEAIPKRSDIIINQMQSFMQLFLEMCMILCILFVVNYQLAFLSLFFFFISLIILHLFKRYINIITLRDVQISMEYNTRIQDILSRQALILTTNNQEKEQENFIETYNKMMDTQYLVTRFNNLINPLFLLFQIICIMIIGLILGKTLLFESVSVSAAIIFIALFQRGMSKMKELGMVVVQLRSAWKILEKLIEDIIFLKPAVNSGSRKFVHLVSGIEFRHLSFKYDKRKVLKDLSVSFPAQKMTIITGKNGSGKSTIISLILRFYNCPKRSLCLDGIDIHRFDIPSLRSRIAYVAQDIILFHGTLRENITYGQSGDISEDKLNDVIRKVGLSEVVGSLPEGLDTNIGDGGKKFSGGQRQRIAIARALLSTPDIIIFDEATKSIDKKTEELIMNMLVDDFTYTTRIVISHNENYHSLADQVIVLNQGSVESIQTKN